MEVRNVYFVSLGCSKNLVDSQVMLGKLAKQNYKVAQDPKNAQVIIVNTCSFLQVATEESINTILELSDYKEPDKGKCQALVVAGCMVQRYTHELEKELPEVDLFIGTGEYHKVDSYLDQIKERSLKEKTVVGDPRFIHSEIDPRVNTSPSHSAWLKISEGCDRNCTFCIIPTLRGRARSRTIDSLVQEAQKLVKSGVRELNLVAQDLSNFGKDLAQGESLNDLLIALNEIEGLKWIRPFYFYPDDLSPQFMETIARSEKICNYLDMPVQHFSDKILKRMNRKITGNEILQKILKLRESIPGIVLRTSIIVGFPGETEEDFETLLQGMEKVGFDHVGVFKYSDEPGTPAFNLKEKVPQEIIEERYQKVYQLQKNLLAKKNKKLVGQVLETIVEGVHEETSLLLIGRFSGQAPEIDGRIIINEGNAQIGDFVKVEITDTLDYDLLGKVV